MSTPSTENIENFEATCYKDLFEYLFPVVALKIQRDLPISPNEKVQDMTEDIYINKPLPPNKFLYKSYPGMVSADSAAIVRPNYDTIYSIAYLEVGKTPVSIYVPEITDVPDKYGGGKRFWGIQLMNSWTDTFQSFGSENNSKEGSYVVTGPSWREKNTFINKYNDKTVAILSFIVILIALLIILRQCNIISRSISTNILIFLLCLLVFYLISGPRKYKEVYNSPTDFVWVISRINTVNLEDANENTAKIQRKLKINYIDEKMEKIVFDDYMNGMILPPKYYNSKFCTNPDNSECNEMYYCDVQSSTCKPYTLICTNNEDCPLDYSCDTIANQCKPLKGLCESGTDCKIYQDCVTDSQGKNGMCKTRTGVQCINNSQCKSGYCNYNYFRCEQPPCGSSSDCPLTGYCNISKGQCEEVRGKKCTDKDDCLPGEICNEITNICESENKGCDSNEDCVLNTVCNTFTKECQVPCNRPEDCLITGYCNLDSKTCTNPPRRCNVDGDCPFTEICYEESCTPPLSCNTTNDGEKTCPSGFVCDEQQNQCIRDQGTACDIDEDCIDTGYCPSDTGFCRVRPECEYSTDCSADEYCNNLPNFAGSGYCQRERCNANGVNTCDNDAECIGYPTPDDLNRGYCTYIYKPYECTSDKECKEKNTAMFCDVHNDPVMCKFKGNPETAVDIGLVSDPLTNDILFSLGPKLFFELASYELSTHTQITPLDEYKSQILESINIIPATDISTINNFQWNSIPFESKLNMIYSYETGRIKLLKDLQQLVDLYTSSGKWINIPVGTYGTDYSRRAAIAYQGLGANPSKTAIYMSCMKDSSLNNNKLDGSNSTEYELIFDGTVCRSNVILPPVDGFWSLTVYDLKGYPVSGTGINNIGNRTDTQLEYNTDGTLSIYLSNKNYANSRNWLPIPESEFTITARFYLPRSDIIEGKWTPPSIKEIYNCTPTDAKKFFPEAFDSSVTSREDCMRLINEQRFVDHKATKMGCTSLKQVYEMCPKL